MKTSIIALGRQFGSGGREIGKQLAERLNVRCYDRELITLAAQKAEVREELFAGREEKAPNPWLFTGVYEGGPQVRKGQPAEDILFEMQSQVILELARMGPCIIVGRCADVVLRAAGIPTVSLFICAPFEDRVKRRMEIEGIGQKEAEDAVRKIDKRRKKYYDTYTGRNWGTPENYDFCINSSVRGIEGTVEQIITCARGA
ncbi:AAA family ATPase [uncultured Flavonifractor sp.]|uniref:cytidylate kinase-like family protein n=1 Tax=uncultured Flavonifractor sp. TaxID=1193534 RepID=UPI00174D67C5|nr:cytidylate kinase-like family protein [uncultured Flavonifractor sp.]